VAADERARMPDKRPLLELIDSLVYASTAPQAPYTYPAMPLAPPLAPSAYFALYDALKLQCRQCGFRFRDDEHGNKGMGQHLDAHFRRNTRMKDKARPILSRVWFQKEEDWINNVEVSDLDRPANLFEETTVVAPKKIEDQALPKVPAGDDHGTRSCCVCKEEIELRWDDEADEWMYINAVRAENGEMTHSTCLSPTI